MTHKSEGPDMFRELQKIYCGQRINRASEEGAGENSREVLKNSFEKDLVSQVSQFMCNPMVSKQLLKHGNNVLRFVWRQDYFGSNIEDTLKAKIQERKF